jgi:uncharacterized repeat protein (TIGR01451 family)
VCSRCLSLIALMLGLAPLSPAAPGQQPTSLPPPGWPALQAQPPLPPEENATAVPVHPVGHQPAPLPPPPARGQPAPPPERAVLPLPPDPPVARPADADPRDLGQVPGATVFVDIQGPGNVEAGQEWPCMISVRNAGSTRALQVRVELTLPAGVHYLSADPPARNESSRLVWELGDLEVHGRRSLTVNLKPDASGREGTVVSLRPEVRFAVPGLQARVVRPDFAVHMTAPSTAPLGGDVTFQITLRNQGSRPVEGVVLQDHLPPGLSHPEGDLIQAELGTLNPGQEKTVSLRVQADRPGRWLNRVQASTRTGHSAQTEVAVLVEETPLRLALQGPDQGVVGQEMEWQVEIANPGDRDVRDIQITQEVPSNLTFVHAEAGGQHDPYRGQILWTIPALRGKETQTVVFRLRAQQAGELNLVTRSQVAGRNPIDTRRAITIQEMAALTLEVFSYKRTIRVGEETICEMRILNRGAAPAHEVGVRVRVPAGIRVVALQGPTSGEARGEQILFAPVRELPTRTEVVYRLRVRGQSPSREPMAVELTADGLPHPLGKELITEVQR